jgi:hypothetical protein
MRSALPALLLAAIAAGCGGAHAAAPAATTTGAANLARAWHQVVVCARAHGMPNLQDPQIDASGKAIFPDGLNIPDETRRACQSMVDRLIPGQRDRPPTAADLVKLRAYAQCMRRNGIADWPDPNPDGTFTLPPPIANVLKSAFRSQLETCARLNPDANGSIHFSRAS